MIVFFLLANRIQTGTKLFPAPLSPRATQRRPRTTAKTRTRARPVVLTRTGTYNH